LQQGSRELTHVWDLELSEAGEEITVYRAEYLEKLRPIFFNYAEQLLSGSVKITRLSFEQGWTKSAKSFLEYLKDNYQRDSEMGYTQRGPHRADLKLDIEQGALVNYGSGGQQKLVTCALLLSQVALFKQESGKQCTILVDDLPAELDSKFRDSFIQLLIKLNSQLFITATETNLLDINQIDNNKMFHVKHGEIEELKHQ
jgi:DNA replication and repair protein RecF